VQPESFDIVLNAEHTDAGQMAEILRAAVAARGLVEHGLLSAAGEAQLQFQTRLHLAKHKIVPAGRASVKRIVFGHPSEENLRQFAGFLSHPLGVRAAQLPASMGQGRQRHGSVHTRFLLAGI